MMINTPFFTLVMLVLMILFSILTVMHADPCPKLNQKYIADMCTDDYVEEDNVYGSKTVDSVVLRIAKQQNNCICHVTLQNTATNYTIYMSKYNLLRSAAPVEQNCGLAVDVYQVNASDTSLSLTSIECTSGTKLRSIALGGNELKLKSKVIHGVFNSGYCMQIYRNLTINDCNMIDRTNFAGTDGDWIATYGTHHTSLEECKQYCLQTKACVAVHYEDGTNKYCFVYNQTTQIISKDDSNYSQKHCVDTQKLKIRCFPPESILIPTSLSTTSESTTKTSQSYPQESTTKTSQGTTTEDNRSTKTETVTTPISDIPVTQSSITVENYTTKDTNSDLYVYIGAGAGGLLMIMLIICIIVCIRKHSNQTSEKESKNFATKQVCREDRDSDSDYGGLKDNILYVSSEPNEILEDGNYNTVDLEQTRKVNQVINVDGDYSTVDGICSTSSISKSKPGIKPKPNSSLKIGPDEETIHLSTTDNSNNEYAVVDKGRISDAVKHINPAHGNDTEYAVVNKVKKSSDNN